MCNSIFFFVQKIPVSILRKKVIVGRICAISNTLSYMRSIFLFNRVKSQRDFILRYITYVLFELRSVHDRMICVHVHRVL